MLQHVAVTMQLQSGVVLLKLLLTALQVSPMRRKRWGFDAIAMYVISRSHTEARNGELP